jgi:uncharacterized membrane protein YdjX (TVP38/TMEM64 family)
MYKKKILLLIIIACVVALFYYFDLAKFLSLAELKANHTALVKFYEQHRFPSIILFVTVYVIQTALSLPGAAVLSLAAGAIFGAGMGTLYVNIGATAGATLAFLVARYLFRDAIQRRFGPRLEKMNSELESRGFNYLLFLRLVPVFPFFLINLSAGLTKMPLRTFFLGTMVGIIPGSFVYCNAGASLTAIKSMSEIASLRVLGSFALLGFFALIPVFYQKLSGKPS